MILASSWLILQWVSNPLRIEIDGGRRKRASFIASSEERDQPLLFVFERALYRVDADFYVFGPAEHGDIDHIVFVHRDLDPPPDHWGHERYA